MKSAILKLTTLVAAVFVSGNVMAQQPQYSKVKVFTDYHGLQQLAQLGVCTDHGIHKKGIFYINDFSEQELAAITNAGFQYEILVEDVVGHYHKMQENPEEYVDPYAKGGDPCNPGGGGNGINSYPQPNNFNLGSMGGFHTYAEILANLDAMAAAYPNLITVKAPINNLNTVNNNSVFWVRISDNPNTDEAEPELFYNSLIHAREALAGAQLIYYMWYILENYATDPEIQYLVDNTEMYFVPCMNPDGYEYNGQIEPNGGGMWRKNRRDWGNGNYGTDLNRNFSYQWNTTGTSNNPSSNVYCGPSAFSEIETQAYKWFAENRDFDLSMTYHSYGSLLLFPFGYNPVQTPDYDYQLMISNHMTSQNGYVAQLSADLYPASGDTDDWMYAGDLGTKPKVYSFTPEVTGGDFWFPQGEILGYCEGLVYQNLQASWLVTRFALAEDQTGPTISTLNPDIDYEITRMGLQDGGTYDVSITAVGPEITAVGNSVQHTLANEGDVQTGSISLTLDPNIQTGTAITFVMTVDNGLYPISDTIVKVYGAGQGNTGTVILADDGNNTNNWSGGWGTSTSVYLSSTGSLHDSPGGNYQNNDFNTMELNQSIDLTNATNASFEFWALWEIEQGWDYCQIQASSNGGSSWTPLCGLYTVTGNGNQDQGNPLWDGFQTSWVQESVSLNDYLGETIELRFALVSDQAVREDGFYVDDMEVIVANDPNAIGENSLAGLNLGQNMPNPAADYTTIPFELPVGTQEASLVVYDALGKVVKQHTLLGIDRQTRINTSDMNNGTYLYQIVAGDQRSKAYRLTIVR